MSSKRRNLYTAGMVVGANGGAIVVTEKRPRRATTSPERARSRRSTGEEWEDVIAIVDAERLTGRMTDMLDDAADFLRHPPLEGDCVSFVETSLLGDTLGRLLADRGASVGRFALGGDEREKFDASGVWTVPLATLQARVTLLFETRRLLVVDELGEGATILRSLERLGALPDTGTWRDLALAAAIAVWAAERSPSDGPWASAKAPPVGSPEAFFFDERAAVRELAAKERDATRPGRRWRAFVEGTDDDD